MQRDRTGMQIRTVMLSFRTLMGMELMRRITDSKPIVANIARLATMTGLMLTFRVLMLDPGMYLIKQKRQNSRMSCVAFLNEKPKVCAMSFLIRSRVVDINPSVRRIKTSARKV